MTNDSKSVTDDVTSAVTKQNQSEKGFSQQNMNLNTTIEREQNKKGANQ